MIAAEKNIVLIGMPWSGKSTVGVLLAKRLSRGFVDTDVRIQAAERRRLQQIIGADGLDAFRRLEEQYILGLDCRGAVIATGGSVVYSAPAMAHLKQTGVCVYLELPLGTLQERADSVDSRGLVRAPGQTLEDLYRERRPLYQRYADIALPCEGLGHDAVAEAICARLSP